MKVDIDKFKIETEHLLLVPISMKHAEDIFRVFDDEVTKYMYPATPKRIEETESFIQSSIENVTKGTEVVVAILKKDTQELIGGGGVHHMDTKTPEFGIWIKKQEHGHHYGREAIFALKKWADTQLKYEYLVYPAAKENISSRKIAEALGGKMTREYPETNRAGVTLNMVEYHIYQKE